MKIVDTVRSDSDGRTYELREAELFDTTPDYHRDMRRSELAKFFRSRQKSMVLRFRGLERNGDIYIPEGLAESYKELNRVEIGCQTFSGENFKKLKKWALAKPQTKKRK